MSEDVQTTLARLNEQVVDHYQQGRYQQALPDARAALELSRRHLAESHPASIAALANLATLLFTLGDYEQAEPVFEQTLTLQQQTLGPRHPDALTTMNNLASLFFATGDYERAAALYQQVLAARQALLGEQHPDVATSQSNLASLFSATGDYERAAALYQQALATWRQASEESHPRVAVILNNLAALYSSEGDYEQAASAYQQAIAIQRATLGEQHPDLAASLNNLAELTATLGAYDEACALYQQALAILQAAWGMQHPQTAKTLSNLAVLYATMGAYQQAERLHVQALDIKRTLLGELHPDVASSLYDLAALSQDLGDYRQAESSARQALLIMRQTLGEDHPQTAACLRQVGRALAGQGALVQAQEIYQQALAIQLATLGEQHPDLAATQNDLAVVYKEQGQYAPALSLLQQALASERAALGEQHPAVATSLSNIAGLFNAMGDDQQAQTLFQQALTIERAALGEQHPAVAASLGNLAHVYYTQGRYAEAAALFQQALAIQRATLGEQHPDVATSLNNLAMLCHATHEPARAIELVRQAIAIQRATLGEQQPDLAASLSNLAVLHTTLGEYEQAMSVCRQALEQQRALLGDLHPDVGGSLHNLAVCCAAVGRHEEALALLTQAVVIDDHMVDTIFAMSSQRQRLAYLAVLHADLDAFLSLVLCHFSSSPTAVQAAANLVLRRKAITVEALARQQETLLRGRAPDLLPTFQALSMLRQQIVQKELAGPEVGEGQDYRQLLQEWHERKEQLEAELARRLPELHAGQRRQSISWQALAGVLPAGAALLEFVRVEIYDFAAAPGTDPWQPARYLVFVLQASEMGEVQFFDLGEAEQIDQALASFRLALTAAPGAGTRHVHLWPVGGTQDTERVRGAALRRLLFDPLRPALRGCTRLFLAPDGDLARLPFEVLPTDDGGHLLDTYRIRYLGSGRDLLRAPATVSARAGAPLVVADPDFDLHVPAQHGEESERAPGEDDAPLFARLAGTRQEGEQVASLLGVSPVLGAQALEARVKACRSPRLLHIATHGFFLPDRPGRQERTWPGRECRSHRLTSLFLRRVENPLLRCGLALAGANTWNRGLPLPVDAEDGLLTAEDVASLDLLDTELVVLSACETGLGEVHLGEGVFGLRRAFVLAGACTLVMSLWKVPDQQTQELMTAFYHALAGGLPCADALRAGQMALRTRYPHPYFWGAFICQGGQRA